MNTDLEHWSVFQHFGQDHELNLCPTDVNVRQLSGASVTIGGGYILHLKEGAEC